MTAHLVRATAAALLSVVLSCGVAPASGRSTPSRAAREAEAAMRSLLSAWVQRDAEGVLAYYAPSVTATPDRRDYLRYFVHGFTNDRRHVVRVVAVRLQQMRSRGKDKIAKFEVELETTPSFPGKATGRGANFRQYDWYLARVNNKGPWLHDGGGF